MSVTKQKYIFGYDPGGNGNHGLAIFEYCECRLIKTELFTLETTDDVLEKLFTYKSAYAIGIDTLTCLSTGNSGWRPSDRWLKKEYVEITNSIVSPNSLFGSMGLNGISALLAIKERFPNIRITETHPKVIYFELSKTKYDYTNNNLQMDKLISALTGVDINTINDHEWDAAISAYIANQGYSGIWNKDLHKLPSISSERIIEPCGKTNYWWP